MEVGLTKPLLVRRKQAIEFLGISRRLLEQYVKLGVIRPIITPGGHRMFYKPHLAAICHGQ